MEWRATPKQALFLSAQEDEVLFGGAMGGGKSEAILIFSIMRRIQLPGSVGLVLRRTYPELEMSLIARSRQLLTGRGCKYSEQHKRWIFPNGSVLQFGYLERDEDVYRYHSAEFADICFDELTQFSQFQYEYMLSRLRGPKDWHCVVRAASNPGGPGHGWVKARFIDVAPPGKRYVDPVSGMTRRFIPATLDDNPHIDREQYERKLFALPEELREMFRFGRWDVSYGQAFPEFRYEIHTVEPFPIPEWWRRWVANDPGYTDPFVWLWFAADEDGNVYVYREFTREPDEERIPYSEQAARVAELSEVGYGEDGKPIYEKVDMVVCGRDAFTRHPESGKAIVDYYAEGGLPWGCVQALTDRKLGKAAVHEYLKVYEDENTGRPTARLKIFRTCRKLIQTLPMLVVDHKDPERVAECGIDHCYDQETEVLTENGWKRFAEVLPGEKVATLTPDYRVEYQEPYSRVELDYDGPMYLYDGKLLNFCVTPHHRMVVVTQYEHKAKRNWSTRHNMNRWEIRPIEDMEGTMWIPRVWVEWRGEQVEEFALPAAGRRGDVSIPAANLLEFLGFWLAEGFADLNHGHYRVVLTQSDREVLERIASLLPYPYLIERSRTSWRAVIYGRQLYDFLDSCGLVGCGAGGKYIPAELKKLDRPLLAALLKGLLAGDGWKTKSGAYCYATISKQLADDVNEIAIKLGYVSTVRRYDQRNCHVSGRPVNGVGYIYRVSICPDHKWSFATLSRSRLQKVNYKGRVYCLSVPNGTLYVRRNGIPMWCGNCYDALRYGLAAWHAEQSQPPPKPKGVIELHKERLARRLKRRLMQAALYW